MINRIRKVFTFNGIAVLFGVFGSIASLLTLFNTNWNFSINIKWLIFFLFIFLSISILLLKLIFDLFNETKKNELKPSIKIIKYLPNEESFLIEKTQLLGFDAMVSIFYLKDDFEIEIGKAYVSNIQENFIQIKTLSIVESFVNKYSDTLNKIQQNDAKELKNIVIKTYVTRKT